jgi:homoserine dehydrogenase
MSIAILGFGNIGGASFKLIKQNQSLVQNALKQVHHKSNECLVKYVMTRREISKDILGATKWTNNIEDILNDNDVKVVIETIGGTDLAFEYSKKILNSGKHLISANKDLIASRSHELSKLADKNNVKFLFEASCCGGIPIIKTLKDRVRFAKITSLNGIVNGTSNYILTQMYDNDMDFASALKMATALGYAEADPRSDIEGIDAAYKATILASICFGGFVDFASVIFKGIKDITKKDIEYAKSLGLKIKLVAIIKNHDDKGGLQKDMFVGVLPCLVTPNSQLYLTDSNLNGVEVCVQNQGKFFFSGPGAGGGETSASIFNDLMDVLMDGSLNHFGFCNDNHINLGSSSGQNNFNIVKSDGDGYYHFDNCNINLLDIKNTKFFIKL